MKKLKAITTALSLAVMSALTLSGCNMSSNIGDNSFSFGSVFHYEYANSEKYSAGDMETKNEIESLNIDYLFGNLNITGSDTDTVTVKETANVALEDDYKVHTWVDGGVLYVRFCASENGLNFNNIQKNLEITLPGDKTIDDLKIEMTSGDVKCDNMTFKNIDSASTSGDQSFDCEADTVEVDVTSGVLGLKVNDDCNSVSVNATSGDLVIDLKGNCNTISVATTSGNVSLEQTGDADSASFQSTSGNISTNVGNVAKMDITTTSGGIGVNGKYIKDIATDCTSGNCLLVFEQVPDNTKINATSGNITVKIPKDAGITLNVDTTSGDFNYDYSFSKQGDTYVSGDGTAHVEISATSGDVNLSMI